MDYSTLHLSFVCLSSEILPSLGAFTLPSAELVGNFGTQIRLLEHPLGLLKCCLWTLCSLHSAQWGIGYLGKREWEASFLGITICGSVSSHD